MINLILKAVRVLIPFAATWGVQEVVGNAVRATTPIGLSKFRSYAVKIGSWVIGFIITDAVARYVEQRVEEITKIFKKVKKEIKEETKGEEA